MTQPSYYDQIIMELLREREGEVYISDDGKTLYALTTDGGLLRLTGPDFSIMTDSDVNEYIIETMSKLKL